MKKVVWPGSTQLAPVPAVLLGCGTEEQNYNLITVAWAGIVCSKPPMLSVSIRPERHSHRLIENSGEFTVNIPTVAMAKATDWCGVVSGRDYNKFKECSFTPVPGTQVAAPVIHEAPLALECKVTQILRLGSHDCFLAEIVAVQAAEELIDSSGRFALEDARLVGYVHGHYFELGKCIGHFGYSVRKKPGSIVRK